MCIPNDPNRNVLAEIREDPAPADGRYWRCPIHGNVQCNEACATCMAWGIVIEPDPTADHYCEGCEGIEHALIPDARRQVEWCHACIRVMPADAVEHYWPVDAVRDAFPMPDHIARKYGLA